MEKFFKNRQTSQMFKVIVLETLPQTCDFSSLTNLIRVIECVTY